MRVLKAYGDKGDMERAFKADPGRKFPASLRTEHPAGMVVQYAWIANSYDVERLRGLEFTKVFCTEVPAPFAAQLKVLERAVPTTKGE